MPPDDQGGESFLARWSRRKRQADGETRREPATAAVPEAASAPGDCEPEVAPLPPEALPRVEDLTPDSKLVEFLAKGIPEELQRLALRKAWSSDPAIRNFIEVAENQYDWNAGNVPGFGELLPGTDVERLVAHATGMIDKVVARAETEVAAVAPPANTPGEEAASSEKASASEGPTGSPIATADSSRDPAMPVRSARRRHGGALPS